MTERGPQARGGGRLDRARPTSSLVASDWDLALVEMIALSTHPGGTSLSLEDITNRSPRACGPPSSSASRAPRPQWAPSTVGEPFGDTSDAISRQPLRVGRVDRSWCQWHGWGASWQRDKSGRAPRHTGTPFTVKRTIQYASRHSRFFLRSSRARRFGRSNRRLVILLADDPCRHDDHSPP